LKNKYNIANQYNINITTMALRQIISKLFLPNLERDLSRTIASELATVNTMMDSMLAPHVYAFESVSTSTSLGAFGQTGARSAPQQRLVKVELPVTRKGLFEKTQCKQHNTDLSKRTAANAILGYT
jgi:hypothetical protein